MTTFTMMASTIAILALAMASHAALTGQLITQKHSQLEWSTFLGGNEYDFPMQMAYHPSGDIIITGQTKSLDFPVTPDAYQQQYAGGGFDIFLARLSADGTQLLYATYFGGSGGDTVTSIALSETGEIVIGGKTLSTDFPTTTNAFSMALDDSGCGGGDAFVSRFSEDGKILLSSTFLGAENSDVIQEIIIDQNNNAIATGDTASANFPITPGSYSSTIQGPATCPGTFGCQKPCLEGFVTIVSPDATQVLASTFFGGSNAELTTTMTQNIDGEIIIAGQTTSPDFPTTPNAFDTTYNDPSDLADGFISALSSDLTQLQWSTFLGGNGVVQSPFAGQDTVYDIATDTRGNIIATGWTTSPDFPTTPNAFDTTFNSECNQMLCFGDAFVTKLNNEATALISSSFFGGKNDEIAVTISNNDLDQITIAGPTLSSNIPTTVNAYDSIFNGPSTTSDGFIARFNARTNKLLFSTYIGGDDGIGTDTIKDIAKGEDDSLIAMGATWAQDFPTTANAYDTTLGQQFSDAFVTKLTIEPSYVIIQKEKH